MITFVSGYAFQNTVGVTCGGMVATVLGWDLGAVQEDHHFWKTWMPFIELHCVRPIVRFGIRSTLERNNDMDRSSAAYVDPETPVAHFHAESKSRSGSMLA